MRTRNRRRVQSELNAAFADYNMKLKRKRTIFQRITRIVLTLCVLSFLTGVVAEVFNLTGLKSRSGVVSAQEPTREFNPVKIILEKRDMTETDYIVAANLLRIRLAIKVLEESAVHANEDAEYGVERTEIVKTLDKLRGMETKVYNKMMERWEYGTKTD